MLRRARWLVVVIAAVGLTACSDPPPPVSVAEGSITVLNQTEEDWTQVLITVNDHYVGVVPTLKAGGRANAPVSQFQTGHGQRWVQGTQVRKVDVKAQKPDGSPVTLSWEVGQNRR